MPTNFITRLKNANAGLPDQDVVAYGSGSLVSGAATVATGLATISAFTASLYAGTGAHASGVSEASAIQVLSVATGAASVIGIYHAATGVTITSASGTGQFTWIAIGTPVS